MSFEIDGLEEGESDFYIKEGIHQAKLIELTKENEQSR